MKKIVIILLACVTVFLVSCKGSRGLTEDSSSSVSKAHGIQFVESNELASLLEQAKTENKLIFIDFYTSWCLPCRIMDEEVFTQKAVGEKMSKDFISYKVNAEKDNGPSLATIFNVYAYPTLLMLDGEGNILERRDGSLSVTQFLRMADKATAANF